MERINANTQTWDLLFYGGGGIILENQKESGLAESHLDVSRKRTECWCGQMCAEEREECFPDGKWESA